MCMDPMAGKIPPWKNLVVPLLSFAVLVYIARFAYFVAIKGGSCDSSGEFCFFSDRRRFPGGYVNPSSAAAGTAPDSRWRFSVDYYSSVFQDLISEGYLSPHSKALCVDTPSGQDVAALREIGVRDSIGIFKKASTQLVISGEAYRQPFDNNTFDFEFSGADALDRSRRPFDFAAEVSRTLKPGGFAIFHTVSRDAYSFNSFLALFNCCRLIRARSIDGLDSSNPSVREIVLKKLTATLNPGKKRRKKHSSSHDGNAVNKCYIPGYKRELTRNSEPLIQEEPLKPWITLKRNKKKVRYLTSMVDISFKQRYVYIDVGARSYGSSIGSWFKKQYPKQDKRFEVYAIEAHKAFHAEYRSKKRLTLLPYVAWVRNETLFFGIKRDPNKIYMEKGRGMGRIQGVHSSASFVGDADRILGFDFANWLKNTFTKRDFVVMKMDVEGTEFELIPRLITTGAICLIDEIFLECHYNRWQKCCPGKRSPNYKKTYPECLSLFSSLRKSGILVHQWW